MLLVESREREARKRGGWMDRLWMDGSMDGYGD